MQIAFLDEIFKASSSILNALLTILNERVYHNGAEVQKVPLQSLLAASNELPSDQAELSALYDRFLVRGFVDYVSQNNLRHLFEQTEESPITAQLTVADLDRIQHAARSITIPPDIKQAIQSIWIKHQETFKDDRRESLSDRRLKKIIKLLCVSAATNEREQVDLSDVFLLKDCLWNHPDNAEKVRALVLKTLQTFSRQVPQDKNAAVATLVEVLSKVHDKQRYFENTLHWDFDTVWKWDAKEDRAVLRPDAKSQQTTNAKMMDLLTQQIRANIWL